MDEQGAPQREVIHRHSLAVRLTHWINVLCLALLLMSGLAIFNAHPALYWGHTGHVGIPFLLAVGSKTDNGRAVGIIRVANMDVDTPGDIGVSFESKRRRQRR